MTKEYYDGITAALFALIQSIFPVLILAGILDWTSDTIAVVMLVVTNLITTIGAFLQPIFNKAGSNTIKVDFNASGKDQPEVTETKDAA